MDKQEVWGAIEANAGCGYGWAIALLDLKEQVEENARDICRNGDTFTDRLTALEKRVTEAMHHDWHYHTKPLTEPDHTCETCKYAWIDSEDCKRCDLLPVDRLPNDPRCRWTPRETPKADRMARYEEAVMDLYQGLAAGDEIELIRVGCGQTQPWSKTQQRFLGPAVKLDAWLKKAE